MRIETAPAKEVLRGRGRPRRQVEEKVKLLADDTYRTGRAKVVHFTAAEEDDLADLRGQLNTYASSLGRRIVWQRDDVQDVVSFAMVDIKRKRVAA